MDALPEPGDVRFRPKLLELPDNYDEDGGKWSSWYVVRTGLHGMARDPFRVVSTRISYSTHPIRSNGKQLIEYVRNTTFIARVVTMIPYQLAVADLSKGCHKL